VLAPSSHNSQPWKFTVGDGSILVTPNEHRALSVSDSNQRQLFISLGCAIENIIVAADYYNLRSDLVHSSEGGTLITFVEEMRREKDEQHLIFSILRRHTNRNPYISSEEINPDFLNRLHRLSTADIQVNFIGKGKRHAEIADVVIQAGITAMENKGFRQELSRYIKTNFTYSSVGMPAFGMGIPTVVSLAAPSMVRHINMNKLARKKDEALLKMYTPIFCIVSTRGDNIQSWLDSGRIFERITLEAEKQNIKTAPMAAAIQIGEFYRELQSILSSTFRPQVFARMGYTSIVTPHSPRLSMREVTLRSA
jgi:hypothetical protein